MKKKSSKTINNRNLAILVLVLIGVFFIVAAYLKPSRKIDETKNVTQQTAQGILPEVTIILQGVCQNDVLGVQLTLLDGWTCKNSELSELDGFIELNSDLFTINISNLGRGPYCGDGDKPENIDESCTTSAFFQNDKVNLTLFKSYGENKEIFGGIVPLNNIEILGKTWISIKYKNMENQQLIDSQKQELIELLNTIEIVN